MCTFIYSVMIILFFVLSCRFINRLYVNMVKDYKVSLSLHVNMLGIISTFAENFQLW